MARKLYEQPTDDMSVLPRMHHNFQMIVIRVQNSIGPFDRDNTISVSSYIHPLKTNNIISFIIHSYVVQNVSKIEKFCFRLFAVYNNFHLHNEEVCKTCLFCYMYMDTSPPFSRSSWNFCREIKFFTIDKRSEWKKYHGQIKKISLK